MGQGTLIPEGSGDAGWSQALKKNPDFILSVSLAYKETRQISARRRGMGEGKVTERTSLPSSLATAHSHAGRAPHPSTGTVYLGSPANVGSRAVQPSDPAHPGLTLVSESEHSKIKSALVF